MREIPTEKDRKTARQTDRHKQTNRLSAAQRDTEPKTDTRNVDTMTDTEM